MMHRMLAALALALALDACSNPKAASEANFKAAIQDQIASQRACLVVPSGFPRELVEGSFDFGRQAELFDELVSIGLLESEPIQKEVPKNAWAPVLPFSKRAMKTVEGKLYSVTAVGEATVGHASRLSTSFCYGSYQVREVTNFTEPGETAGQTVSLASYTYSAAEIADWARGSEILRDAFPRLARDLESQAEPIKDQAALVLTERGWVHAAMFGK